MYMWVSQDKGRTILAVSLATPLDSSSWYTFILLSMQRFSRETKDTDVKINSICKFEFVDTVKSKNIDQTDTNLVLKLMNIDLLKNKNNYEISLIFSNNTYISLSTEIIEVTLEDQNKDILND